MNNLDLTQIIETVDSKHDKDAVELADALAACGVMALHDHERLLIEALRNHSNSTEATTFTPLEIEAVTIASKAYSETAWSHAVSEKDKMLFALLRVMVGAVEQAPPANTTDQLRLEIKALRNKLERIEPIKRFLAEQVARNVPQDFLRGVQLLHDELNRPIYNLETGELLEVPD